MNLNVRERFAALLLEELKQGERGWYYISVADEVFEGAYLIHAFGHKDAWRTLHSLGWWREGCSTQTTGPIPEKTMARIPEDLRWRKLNQQEAEHLGE